MKNNILKFGIIFFVIIGVIAWALNALLFNSSQKSKASGETMAITFNPTTVTTTAGQDFTVSLRIKPSVAAQLRGYKIRLNFDKNTLKFKAIDYKIGVVSSGIGNVTADAATVNSAAFGQVNVTGEVPTAIGYNLDSANSTEAATLTFTSTTTDATSILTSNDSFYTIVAADGSLYEGWTTTEGNLSVNGVPTATPTPTVIVLSCSAQGGQCQNKSGVCGDQAYLFGTNNDCAITENCCIPIVISPTPTGTINSNPPVCSDSTIPPASGSAPLSVFLHGGGGAGDGPGFDGYQWDFENDGNWDTNIVLDALTHIYVQVGTYHPKYRVHGINNVWSSVCNYPYDVIVSAAASPTPTPTPTQIVVIVTGTPTPTPIPVVGNTVLDMKLKFQGMNVDNKPKTTNLMNVKIKVIGGALTAPIERVGTFMSDTNGIWSGSIGFDSVISTEKYSVFVKGPKHLQKKICEATPTEASSGIYRCGASNITLTQGTNDLDFSGIMLLSGDIYGPSQAQDGLVNSIDISFIRNNLGKSDAATLAVCDIDLSGVCDTRDYSLVINSLLVKTDEI